MSRPILGVIGGSGLYEFPGLADVRSETINTPFGAPSDAYRLGTLGTQQLVFLPRHGAGHRYSPTEVNYRANLYGMKQLGVTHLISVSAVGSMREEIVPGHLVLVDQFIDRTFARAKTFFDDGVAAHVAMADPVCPRLHAHLKAAAFAAGATVHEKGTYLCIEGPQFSTRAESLLYRQWGVDVIGMTNMPEAKLAREAELCYATIALATDYDCWFSGHDSVTVDRVMGILQKNVAMAGEVIRNAALMGDKLVQGDVCTRALDGAVMTAPAKIPAPARERLGLLLKNRSQA